MFAVGQKVVCVEAGSLAELENTVAWLGDPPVLGSVYTITEVFMHNKHFPRDKWQEPHVRLVEIKNGTGIIDLGYRARRFRPLVETKTDIAVFTKMLHTNKVKEDA